MDRPPQMEPGDGAPADAPSACYNVCPRCGGSGRLARGEGAGADARDCPACGGSGEVVEAVGGG